MRTVLLDTDIGAGKSLEQNKELFRASWLLRKVWMFASSEVLKPQVFGVILGGSSLPVRKESDGKCQFATERMERIQITLDMHRTLL